MAIQTDHILKILDSFQDFIKLYGKELMQLDIDFTEDQLMVATRQILNPQSGMLGEPLDKRLTTSMIGQFSEMIRGFADGQGEESAAIGALESITGQIVQTVQSPQVSAVLGMVPFGNSISQAVTTVGGFVTNIVKAIQINRRRELVGKIIDVQKELVKGFQPYVNFYAEMVMLDQKYGMDIRGIQRDFDQLKLEVIHFCKAILKKLTGNDGAENQVGVLAADLAQAVRGISSPQVDENTIDFREVVEYVRYSLRSLYSKYQNLFVQQSKANRYFNEHFQKILRKYAGPCKFEKVEQAVQLVGSKEKELNHKIEQMHAQTSRELEEYLHTVYFVKR